MIDEYMQAVLIEVAMERLDRIEQQLRDLGECLWTARDTIVIYDTDGSKHVGYPGEPQ